MHREEGHGTAVEADVRAIAGDFGLADFVFRIPLVAKGGANREPGDGLLIVGDRGAVIQVKARDPEASTKDTKESANRWAAREISKAIRQANGSRREIERRLFAGESVVAEPERAAHLPDEKRVLYGLPLSGSVSNWPAIIVVSAPSADLDVGSECLVISFHDWLRLHAMLGSVSAMIRYAERVRDNEVSARLGHELDRYMVFYEESATAPDALRGDSKFLPHPTESGGEGFGVLNDLASQIWPTDNPIPWDNPEDYRRTVQFFDEIPPGMRNTIGCELQDLVDDFENGGPTMAVIMASRTSQLVVWLAYEDDWDTLAHFGAELMALTLLRHHEAQPLRPELCESLGLALLKKGNSMLVVCAFHGGQVVPGDHILQLAEERFGPTPLDGPPPLPSRSRSRS